MAGSYRCFCSFNFFCWHTKFATVCFSLRVSVNDDLGWLAKQKRDDGVISHVPL